MAMEISREIIDFLIQQNNISVPINADYNDKIKYYRMLDY